MKKRSDESYWREALTRLLQIEHQWECPQAREELLAELRTWLAQCQTVPRLAQLHQLLTPAISRRRFWSVLVPVERQIARYRVTDMQILDCDGAQEGVASQPLPVTLVVDSLRSAFNLGGILRTAECFGVTELIFCGYTATPEQAAVKRAAMGADSLVRWRHVADIQQVLDEMQNDGVPCVALETVSQASLLEAFEWPWPCALILGNERFGVNPAVVARCEHLVRIAMHGQKNSLNVVSALAVTLYAMRAQFN